jgi:signal transduction histidine kinase
MDVDVRVSPLRRIAQRLREERVTLARRWLDQVAELVTVSRLDVFPSQDLLDHIPEAIAEIANYVEAGGDGSIAANNILISHAAELGVLRHLQRASVHQLLREYRLLAELLEGFVARELSVMTDADGRSAAQAFQRIGESVRVMQQHTIDTFVANYTRTIEQQTTQLRHFSRLVSHEIRQPLAVLQVIARTLPIRQADVESMRMMDIFDRSVARLADVTGKLERLARISGPTDVAPSERLVDLTEVAHTVSGQLADAAAARGVEIHVHPSLPTLWLDPSRAELILANLVANAIKFADDNKRERYVEIYRAAGEQPAIVVRDNGVGMAPTRLQTIFREFVRAHAQRQDEVRAWGIGLGLSIVRECMDHAQGSVRVDSIEGRGTTFKLTWPLERLYVPSATPGSGE